mgnify:CR=1 FL=1
MSVYGPVAYGEPSVSNTKFRNVPEFMYGWVNQYGYGYHRITLVLFYWKLHNSVKHEH